MQPSTQGTPGQTQTEADSWNWPYMLYAGTVWLKLTEEQFWDMLPIKFMALLKVHQDINSAPGKGTETQKTATAYIDQVQGW